MQSDSVPSLSADLQLVPMCSTRMFMDEQIATDNHLAAQLWKALVVQPGVVAARQCQQAPQVVPCAAIVGAPRQLPHNECQLVACNGPVAGAATASAFTRVSRKQGWAAHEAAQSAG